MKKVTLVIVLTLILLISTFSSAGAITNGRPDKGDHPYVGLVVFDVLDEDGNQVPSHRCSASLLSPTVLLTAGHCTEVTIAARVWFNEDLTTNTEYPLSGTTSYAGSAYTFQDFCTGCGNGLPGFAMGDVGIVVLAEPVPISVVSHYAQLPDQGLVDTLDNKTSVDFVGYGVQEQRRGGGPPVWTGRRVRLFAPSELVSGNFVHSEAFLKLALNPGGDSGGTCFGDSGGPDLLGGTNTVLGVNSYVTNSNCSGVGYSFRIDSPDVLEWINSFLQTS
jgi:Trypsin